MALTSRSEVRKFLTTLFRSTVNAQEILDHIDPDISGKVSVLQVLPAGSFRRNFSRGMADSSILLGVVVFVLMQADDWTLDQGADTLDLIEQQMAQAIANNQNTELWRSVEWQQVSSVDTVMLSGVAYLMEAFLVDVEAK